MQVRAILCVMGGCAFCGVLLAAQSSALNKSDRTFLNMAADTNMTEAHLGQMAQTDASASSVRDFGQTLTRDHTNAYQSLTELANQAGVTIPKGIDIRRDHSVEALARLKGANFDRSFLKQEVQDHETALAAFKREAEHGHDAAVKAYAGKMVPILEGHLRTAQRLEKNGQHAG
ncbi:MAG TPA: DUF4142 domain-containing protein [Bryobacteraceae bacterium]|nr:DUF4142 domain-containing protein [Bryobacteraceae bacterium]